MYGNRKSAAFRYRVFNLYIVRCKPQKNELYT